MKLCLITYDAPHRKTAEVFLNLHARGFRKIDFMVFPFKERPARQVAFEHRPPQFEGPHLRSLAEFAGARLIGYEDWRAALDAYDRFIVCGAGLVDPAFADSGKILNCHPGLIPIARGLDAFKWSVLRGRPVGNTLHTIDSGVDAGEVHAHLVTPRFPEDDLKAFADRHYRREIFMLSNFDHFLEHGEVMDFGDEDIDEPTKRMKMETEAEMMRRFSN